MAGTLLVERGLVTSAQLAEALEHQRTHGGALDEVVSKLFRLPLADLRVAMSSDVSQIDVGAILYATGIVDAEKLAEARSRSLATGQPVGPVLVEMGAVTRLELASALADQWSDSPAMILPAPNARGADGQPNGRGDVDDLKFAMRALEASVRAARVTDGSDASLDEVVRREIELAARVAALEAAMAQPVEVDAAFLAEFQATVRRTHEIEAALAGLAPAEALASFSAAVDEARELQIALAQLSERVDYTASREALDGVMGAVAELGARVDGLAAGEAPPTVEEIAALRATVEGLAARPSGDPDRAESLAQRIEELAAALPSLDVSDELGALRAQLEELAARPVSDEALHARVDELGRSVEALSVLAEASSGAEGLQDALAGLSARLDEGLAGNADLAAAVAAVGERLDVTDGRLADGTALLGELVTETRGALDALSSRVDDGGTAQAEAAEAIAELRETLTELAGRPAGDPGLPERVAGLAERVEALSLDALGPAAAAAVADVAGRLDELARAQLEETERLEALRSRIEEVRGELTQLAASQPGDNGLSDRLEETSLAIAELAARIDSAASAEHVAELRGRLAELGSAGLDEGTAERLAAIEESIRELGKDDGSDGFAELQGRLDELAAAAEERVAVVLERVEALESAEGAVVGAAAPEVDELRGEVSAVRSSVESVRESLAAELERLASTWAAERETLKDRIAALADSSAAVAADGGAAPSAAPAAPEMAKLAREMERLQDKVVEQERSLVEHFARREKALSEKVTGGTDIVQRLAEITRMIDEQRSRIDRVSSGGGRRRRRFGRRALDPQGISVHQARAAGVVDRLALPAARRWRRWPGRIGGAHRPAHKGGGALSGCRTARRSRGNRNDRASRRRCGRHLSRARPHRHRAPARRAFGGDPRAGRQHRHPAAEGRAGRRRGRYLTAPRRRARVRLRRAGRGSSEGLAGARE